MVLASNKQRVFVLKQVIEVRDLIVGALRNNGTPLHIVRNLIQNNVCNVL